MPSKETLSLPASDLLRCPKCHASLCRHDNKLRCSGTECHSSFPIVDGIPVIIDESASIFSFDDFIMNRPTTLQRPRPGIIKGTLERILGSGRYVRLKKRVRKALPTIDLNINTERNFSRLRELLLQCAAPRRVLILGGGILGDGISALMHEANIEFVESDVSFGPRTKLICDAHDIPFHDGSFDAVVAQAVLEHVVDPHRCVEEIHRVLKQGGLIYAETPFIQQVHAGRYDFTRWTHLGHRRLFRYFEEIDSGAVCGPGMALAWSYQYFLLSFVTSRWARTLMKSLAAWTAFHLKYFDPMLGKRRGTLDAASGFYLLGRRAEQPLDDRELLKQYRGLDST